MNLVEVDFMYQWLFSLIDHKFLGQWYKCLVKWNDKSRIQLSLWQFINDALLSPLSFFVVFAHFWAACFCNMVTFCFKGPKTSTLFRTLSWLFCNCSTSFCSWLNINRSYRSLLSLFFLSCVLGFFTYFFTSLISGSSLSVLYVPII